MIGRVEQQQFLGVAHVPCAADPAAAERECTVRLARRRAQLAAAAVRLRLGAEALAERSRLDGVFLKDVAELRRRWRVGRHPAPPGGTVAGAFHVDLSLALAEGAGEGIAQDGALHTVVPDAAGLACIVLEAGDKSKRVVRGPEAIGAALQRQQAALAWRIVEQMIARDARLPPHSVDADGAVAALQRLARAAVQRSVAAAFEGVYGYYMDVDRAESQAEPGEQPACEAAATSAAGNVLALCASAATQARFESKALHLLSAIVEASRTPALVAAARSTPPRTGMLPDLATWLRHSALRRGVAATLAQQAAAAAAQGREVAVQQAGADGELTVAWKVLVGGAEAGQVLVEGACVRWEGGDGARRALGRKQLRQLVLALGDEA